MENQNISKEILQKLEDKFQKINQKTETHLEGLLWSKPITYWDYIQTDALLNLQVQRTTLPDEMVFIMYHQVNELLFKMILWEIEQICKNDNLETAFFTDRLMRISRYFDMLTDLGLSSPSTRPPKPIHSPLTVRMGNITRSRKRS